MEGTVTEGYGFVTRDGRPARFVETRNAGSRLIIYEIEGELTVRREDGRYRWDEKLSPHDVLVPPRTPLRKE